MSQFDAADAERAGMMFETLNPERCSELPCTGVVFVPPLPRIKENRLGSTKKKQVVKILV